MDEYAELAAAIVRTAITDYHEAAAELLRHPRNEDAKSAKYELVHFFHSDWFSILSDMNGERLIRKIDEMEKGDTYDSD